MSNQIDIVVIGTIIKETIIFPNKTIGPVLGSPAAYSGLVMAAQGKNVGIVTYCGKDMGELIAEIDVLDHRGIIPYEYTTTNELIYKENGKKYVKYQKATPKIKFDNIPQNYLEARFYKICPMNYEVEIELVKTLHKMGKVVFVDLGGYGGATSEIRHSVNEEEEKTLIDALCQNSTIIKASEEDLQSIIPGKTPEEALEYLVNAGAKNVVITLGEKGVMYKSEQGTVDYVKPFVAQSQIEDGSLDFTGAGDSFGAGFMASFISEQNMTKAAINGNATASLVIEKSGGCTFDRMPTEEQVLERKRTKKECTA